MATLEEQIAAIQQQLDSTQAPTLPPLPRASPDDGRRPGWTGILGDVLSGGQSPTYRLRGSELDAAGNRALLNFGLNMMLASGPQRVRPDLFSGFASGLQGAQQSMDLDQRRAAAVAQQDYQQRMELAKLGVEQDRDRIERLKALIPLLQMQNRPVINADGSVSTAGAAGGITSTTPTAAVPGAIQLTGDREKDRPIIQQRESGGDPTALNYVARADPTAYARGATAGGLYGFTNTTWAEGAKLANVDTSKYPTARSAPKEEQDKVYDAVYDKYGTAPWDPSKWGQNWVKNAQGGYDLVKTGTSGTTAATSAPPGARTQVATATPTTATDATTAPAPVVTPPAPAATSTTTPPATTPPPAATGPLAGLPHMNDFITQNMAKPSPEEEALWKTPLSPEAEKAHQDNLKRLQSAVDAARATFNAPGAKEGTGTYDVAQKAYTAAQSELVKARDEAKKVGDDRKAKWLEGERTRVATLYGKLVEGNAKLLETKESSDQQLAREQIGKINESANGARRNLAQVDQIQALSDLMGPSAEGILTQQISGKPLAAFLQQYNIGTDQLKTKAGAILAFKSLTDRFITDMRAGQGLGPQSDRDLTQAQGWVVNAGMDGATRNAMLALMRDTYLRQVRYSSLVQRFHAGGMKLGEAEDKADQELGPAVPRMDKGITAGDPRWGQWLTDHNVQPNTFYRDPDGKMRIYKGQ